MILTCLFLAWLILPTKPEPVSIQPTDGLVEQVQSVEDSFAADHIGDITKKVEAKKEIVIFSVDGCKPCKDWVAIEQPKFQKAGWKVVKSDDPMTGPWPHFMIETNGKKIEYRSYLLFDKIDEVSK